MINVIMNLQRSPSGVIRGVALLLFCIPFLVHAQEATILLTKPSINQNYTLTSRPRVAGMFTAADLSNRKTAELMQSIQYFDGLGRPLQTVSVSGSPLAYDLVSPVIYDSYGRVTTTLLPYTLTGSATNDGSYKAAALTAGVGQGQYYSAPPTGIVATSSPFSVATLEASPLNRVLEQGAEGVSWQPASSGLSGSGHTQKIVYSINNAITWASDTAGSRQAALFTVTINADQSRTLVRTSGTAVYGAGQLTMTVSKDENWRSGRAGTNEVYTDKESHQVLRRVYTLSGSTLQQLSIYYVYDDLGNLSFVLPPGCAPDSGLPVQATLDNLGYQYQYDSRNRLVQKKLPGKGWEYKLYNTLDQVVATQDANQRANSQWIYTKYDALGRIVLSGLYSSTSTRPALQSVVDGQTVFWETPVGTSSSNGGYTSTAWPTGAASFLTINYYDTYTVAGLPGLYTAPSGSSLNTRSLLTASQTNILGTTNMPWMVPYYDDLGRVIQSYLQHNQENGATLSTGNYDVVKTKYNFSNQDTATTRQHYNVAISTTAVALTVANS